MLTDRYGLRLSTTSSEARDAYIEGCDLLLRMYPGAAAAFARATAADLGFAIAHAARARVLQLGGDPAGAREAVAAARGALAGGTPERDVSHVAVFDLVVGGRPAAALEALRRHVASWPRDAMAANLAANQTGLIGISGSPSREQDQLDFLASLAPHYGDDWWFNGHYAFALSELGHQSAARPLIERSMAQCPCNAYLAHTMAHFHYENGEPDAAASFLRSWLADYPREGMLHGHLSWHLAIVELQAGAMEEALRLFDRGFAGEDHPGPALVKLLDAPSFLWRAELAGHPRDHARWEALRGFVRRLFPRPGLPYADWHVALVDAVAGDRAEAEARTAEIEDMVREGRYPAGATVATFARALGAFERRDYGAAITGIEGILAERERMGGSRAQLDLVEFTLLRAYLAAGRHEDARRLTAARRAGPRGIPVAGLEAVQVH
ncbi:tetratricopeptide repeat protein 38 family protein [Siccirubricoccus deserti]|uniref:Tetratricopeptide repeat protein 38 n=1 Tax=Siccirubricoccus deserti TaxID=2013562 RepID=A0A9X0UFU3_9PROT|nr:tetratricopeptide repeat protein [Siccirubricoccus deserti]MBC4019269.1 tetratricopeptide repeat protein [Siccirubricoccus deserti]GGC73046.1 tetratricopeptide repeat protein 38 family protein [Siccirubricoccus deserti]